MKDLSKTIEYKIIKGYDTKSDLIKIREINSIQDGSIFITPKELEKLYKIVFGIKPKRINFIEWNKLDLPSNAQLSNKKPMFKREF